MDLSLLPHLSDRALREEAERRGIVFEGLEREALVEAIRAHEARRMTIPPAPPEPETAGARGALNTARSLLGRVVGLARSALERRSEPPPSPSEAPAEEPIRTRSLARLLEDQGHLERALSIVRQLAAESPDDDDLARWAAHLERRIAERTLSERSRAELTGVEIVPAGALRGAVWSIDDAGLARARALLGAEGELTLRVIRVLAHEDYRVETHQEDRRALESRGWALLDAPERARLIVSAGLSDGARFVSIAHASA